MPSASVGASAPGKVILFGEHAVVYGEPSLSVALDRRLRVSAAPTEGGTTVNDQPLDVRRHSYVNEALKLVWSDGPLRITTASDLPSASGIGSSAALSVATTATLLRMRHGSMPAPEAVARAAFETEFATQGAASPNDTTVVTAGGAVLLAPAEREEGEVLWHIAKGDREWVAHRLRLPELPLVVAHSGSRARTGVQVAKVALAVQREPSKMEIIREIGRITLDAVPALNKRDLGKLGDLMNRNHECLAQLGVDSPNLNRLCDAARSVPGTHGAKLTGAGGGGSVVVLTERPQEVRKVLERLGAPTFIGQASPRGLEVEP